MDDLQTFRTMYLAGWISHAQWRKLYKQEGWKKRELDERNNRFREKNTARIKKNRSDADIKNEAVMRWKMKNPIFYRPASELICLREEDHVRVHFLGRPWVRKV